MSGVTRFLVAAAVAAVALAAVAAVAIVLSPSSGSGLDLGADGDVITADQYHKLVRENVPAFAVRDDASLDRLAVSVCEVFRAGGTWVNVIDGMLDAGISGGDAGKMARIAVTRACPEYEANLPAG